MCLDHFGDDIFVSYTQAKYLFDNYFKLPCTFILLGIVALCVLTPKTKRFVTALPTVLTLVILGTAVTLSASVICSWNNIPAQHYAFARYFFAYMGLGAAAMLIGIFLWCQAVAQGRVSPAWQIVVPVVIPLVYFVLALLVPIIVVDTSVICWSFIATGMLLSIICLCFRRPKALKR